MDLVSVVITLVTDPLGSVPLAIPLVAVRTL
jgi:hypothetical protein